MGYSQSPTTRKVVDSDCVSPQSFITPHKVDGHLGEGCLRESAPAFPQHSVASMRPAPDHLALLRLAGTLAQRGLVTLANRVLMVSIDQAESEQYVANVTLDPVVIATASKLKSAIARMPSDAIDVTELSKQYLSFAAQLEARGIPGLQHAAAEWLQRTGEWFSPFQSGFIQHLPTVSGGSEIGQLVADVPSAWATQAAATLIDASQPYTHAVVVCGSVMLASAAIHATSAPHLGYTPLVWFVEEDLQSFCDGLWRGLRDGSTATICDDSRVKFCVASDALTLLADQLKSRDEWMLPQRVMSVPNACDDLAKRTLGVLETAHERQRAAIDETHLSVTRRYAGRDVEWWKDRWRVGTADATKTNETVDRQPLKFLVVTTRYTTYVQHVAKDLAKSLLRAGFIVDVMIEPDQHASPCALAYLRSLDRLRPDCIITVNYPRCMLGPVCPGGVMADGRVHGLPFVCWIQDALSHLFDSKVGAAQGPLDFTVGHAFHALFEKFGFPIDQAFSSPVVADAVKFSPSGGHNAPRLSHVAHVSRQSGTPQALHAELVKQAYAASPRLAEVFEALQADVQAAVNDCNAMPLHKVLEAHTRRQLAAAGFDIAQPRMIQTTLRGYALRMADRLLRHETLGFIHRHCESQGLSLRLYGEGWESHPTLSSCAAGPLAHGEELRSVYERTELHLHISAQTLLHQRVLECLLSGGLCAVRMHRDGLGGLKTAHQLCLLGGPPDVVQEAGNSSADSPQGRFGYYGERHPAAAKLLSIANEYGQATDEAITWIRRDRAESMLKMAELLRGRGEISDLFSNVHQVLFSDERTFSSLINRVLTDETWRTQTISQARAVALHRFTHDAFAARLVAFIQQRLDAYSNQHGDKQANIASTSGLEGAP